MKLKWILITFFMAALLTSGADIRVSEWMDLWEEGEMPTKEFTSGWNTTLNEHGHYSEVHTPKMQIYYPKQGTATGASVVIFPGGGYWILAADHEGDEYARWLAERGVLAVVAQYRVGPKPEDEMLFPLPLLDARRAIRSIRLRADELGVDPNKIGVMGSSAGGHLTSMCATLWDESLDMEGNLPVDQVSCRPDFAVLVYPVISMTESFGHAGSKDQLVGKHDKEQLASIVSAEKQVNEKTPPCFLVHSVSDTGVPAINSVVFAEACLKNGVQVVNHLFVEGGHGYGMRDVGDCSVWPELLEDWMQVNGWMNK